MNPDTQKTQSETRKREPRKRHPVRRLLIVVLASYLGLMTLVAVFQRSLLYVPFRESRITAEDAGLLAARTMEVTVSTSDGLVLHGWRVRPADERRRTILYCPGNAANRVRRVSSLEILSEQGSEVFLFDYRGYGDNEGSPTEEAIASDLRQIWNWLTKEQGIPPGEIVIYGQSLGGGVAIRLVSELAAEGVQPAGLVLVATFSSMVDAAKNRFGWLPVDWLLLDRYPSENRIQRISCPILHLHGDRDRIVPLPLGRKLFRNAPARSASGEEKRFVELAGAGHNNILRVAREKYRREILQFLPRVCP